MRRRAALPLYISCAARFIACITFGYYFVVVVVNIVDIIIALTVVVVAAGMRVRDLGILFFISDRLLVAKLHKCRWRARARAKTNIYARDEVLLWNFFLLLLIRLKDIYSYCSYEPKVLNEQRDNNDTIFLWFISFYRNLDFFSNSVGSSQLWAYKYLYFRFGCYFFPFRRSRSCAFIWK